MTYILSDIVICGYLAVQLILLYGIYREVTRRDSNCKETAPKKSLFPKKKNKPTEEDLRFKRELEKMAVLRSNIDIFDGTSIGQKEIK